MDVTCADIRRQLCRPIIGFRRRQIYALNLNMDEPIQLQFRMRRPSEIRTVVAQYVEHRGVLRRNKEKENGGSVYIRHCELATIQSLALRNLFRRLAI